MYFPSAAMAASSAIAAYSRALSPFSFSSFPRHTTLSSLRPIQRCGQCVRHCSAISCESSSRISPDAPDLVDWITSEGGFVHSGINVGINGQNGSGLGLFASSAIAPGTVLISLPRRIPMRLRSFDFGPDSSDSLLAELAKRLPEEMWSLKLGLKLLHERAKDESFWWPYMANLPQTFSVPIFFNKQEVQALQYLPLIHQVNKRCKLLLNLENYIQATVEQLSPKQHPFSGQHVNSAALGWAMSAVSSRAFRLHGEPMNSGGSSGDPMLLPLIDMCNHSFSPNASLIQDPACDDGFVKVVSKENIQEGTAILLDYGRLSNDLLLLDYGFVVPENKHDLVEIRYDRNLLVKAAEASGGFSPPSPWQAELLHQLKLEGDQAVLKMDIGGDALVDGRLLAALRILFADDPEIVKKHDLSTLKSLDHEAPVGVDKEIKACQTITVLCALLLGYFETMLGEDVQIIGKSGLCEAMKLAVSFRISKKEVIIRVMKAMTQRVNRLRKISDKET